MYLDGGACKNQKQRPKSTSFSSHPPINPSDSLHSKKMHETLILARETMCCLIQLHFSYSIFLVKTLVKTQNWFHEFFAPIFFKTDSQRPVFWAATAARTQQSAPYFTSHPTRRPPRSWDISPTTVYAVCCAGLRPAAADPE